MASLRRLSGNERTSTSFLTRPSLVGCLRWRSREGGRASGVPGVDGGVMSGPRVAGEGGFGLLEAGLPSSTHLWLWTRGSKRARLARRVYQRI